VCAYAVWRICALVVGCGVLFVMVVFLFLFFCLCFWVCAVAVFSLGCRWFFCFALWAAVCGRCDVLARCSTLVIVILELRIFSFLIKVSQSLVDGHDEGLCVR